MAALPLSIGKLRADLSGALAFLYSLLRDDPLPSGRIRPGVRLDQAMMSM
jgi:hypothetical protein